MQGVSHSAGHQLLISEGLSQGKIRFSVGEGRRVQDKNVSGDELGKFNPIGITNDGATKPVVESQITRICPMARSPHVS